MSSFDFRETPDGLETEGTLPIFAMPESRPEANPWAPVTALLWLAFTVALACAPALVWAAYRGAF